MMNRLLSSESEEEVSVSAKGKKRKVVRVYESSSDEDSDSSDDLSDMEEVENLEESEANQCSICLGQFGNNKVGRPENCRHIFCLDCILEWSKNINTCPVDRRLFNLIFVQLNLNGPVTEEIYVEDKKAEEPEEMPPTYCEVCQECNREDELLLCDECDNGYHLDCLTPPIEHVPIDEWFCPQCTQDASNDDSGPATRRQQRASASSPELRGTDTLADVALRAARPRSSTQAARTVGSQRRRSSARSTSQGRSRRKKSRKRRKTSKGGKSTTSKRSKKSGRKKKGRQRHSTIAEKSSKVAERAWHCSTDNRLPQLSLVGDHLGLNDFDLRSESDDNEKLPSEEENEPPNPNLLDGILTNLEVLSSKDVKIERSGKLTLQKQHRHVSTKGEPRSDNGRPMSDIKVEQDVLEAQYHKSTFSNPLTKMSLKERIQAAMDGVAKRRLKQFERSRNTASSSHSTFSACEQGERNVLRNFKIPKKSVPAVMSSSQSVKREIKTSSSTNQCSSSMGKSYDRSRTTSRASVRDQRKAYRHDSHQQSSSRFGGIQIDVNSNGKHRNKITSQKRTADYKLEQQSERNLALFKLLDEQKKTMSSVLGKQVEIDVTPVDNKTSSCAISNPVFDKQATAASFCTPQTQNLTSDARPVPVHCGGPASTATVSSLRLPVTTSEYRTLLGRTSNASWSSGKPVAVVSPSVSTVLQVTTSSISAQVLTQSVSSSNKKPTCHFEQHPSDQIIRQPEGIERHGKTNRIIDTVKSILLPYFRQHMITKEQYKIIMKRCVEKIKASRKDVIHDHVVNLVKDYVQLYSKKKL